MDAHSVTQPAHTDAPPSSLITELQETVRAATIKSPSGHDVYLLGRQLAAAKAAMKHGEYQEFVADTLGLSDKIASEAKRIALAFPEGQPRHVLVHQFGKMKLAELARLDTDDLDMLALDGKIEQLSLQDIHALSVKSLHAKLAKLQGALKDAPAHTAAPVVEVAATQVPAKVAVDRNSERRKQYSRELCRVIARYADEDEVRQLTRALEDVAAWILARRPCPGLNDASYSVFNRFGRIGGAQ